MNNTTPTLDLSQVTYDTYISSAGVKNLTIIEVIDDEPKNGYVAFKLKCEDQNGEIHFENFNLTPYGLRKIKKFVDKTKVFNAKEMKSFNHFNFITKKFNVEYFLAKNKHYDSTNPNSKEYHLVVGNETYAPHKPASTKKEK